MLSKLALTLSLAAALGAVASAPAAAGPKGKDAPVTIFVSELSFSYPHFVFLHGELEDEANKIGHVKVIKSDGQLSAPKQIADIEAAVVQGVDGIIIAPADADALAPAVRSAIQAGVPVVTIDRPVNGVPEVLANVAADNFTGAVHQGEAVAKLFPNGATIVNLQGVPGDKTAIDRNAGVHKALDGKPAYKFVAEQTARFSRDQGLAVTENILTGLPQPPQVIVNGNDDSALSCAGGRSPRPQGQGGDLRLRRLDRGAEGGPRRLARRHRRPVPRSAGPPPSARSSTTSAPARSRPSPTSCSRRSRSRRTI